MVDAALIKLALDTSYILGRGAVKDTWSLLGDGVVSLIRVLADLAGQSPETWAKAHDLARFFDGSASSLKGARASIGKTRRLARSGASMLAPQIRRIATPTAPTLPGAARPLA